MKNLYSIIICSSRLELDAKIPSSLLMEATEAAPEGERIADLVEHLGMIAHPEGGYFIETYRAGAPPMRSQGLTDGAGACIDVATCVPGRGGSGRSAQHVVGHSLCAHPQKVVLA